MSSEIAGLSPEITALHAGYEDGVEPQTIIAEVYRRTAAVEDLVSFYIYVRSPT